MLAYLLAGVFKELVKPVGIVSQLRRHFQDDQIRISQLIIRQEQQQPPYKASNRDARPLGPTQQRGVLVFFHPYPKVMLASHASI
jgi:hypothetical protein